MSMILRDVGYTGTENLAGASDYHHKWCNSTKLKHSCMNWAVIFF